MIVILNLNSGNLEALKNAVKNCGHDCIISHPNEISKSATHIILPGVGNYNSCMNFLKAKEYVNCKKDLLEGPYKPIINQILTKT